MQLKGRRAKRRARIRIVGCQALLGTKKWTRNGTSMNRNLTQRNETELRFVVVNCEIMLSSRGTNAQHKRNKIHSLDSVQDQLLNRLLCHRATRRAPPP